MRYLYYIYTLLYIEKERKQTGNGSAKGQTNQEEREPGQRLDCLPSCPPRPRSLPSCGDVGQSKRNRKREPGRRMPPPSSPVPRLSSVPSAASTVHTIASRSPLRPIVPALRERDGRPPRPLLGDAIATTSPPHRHRPITSSRAAPRLSAILPASSSFSSFMW